MHHTLYTTYNNRMGGRHNNNNNNRLILNSDLRRRKIAERIEKYGRPFGGEGGRKVGVGGEGWGWVLRLNFNETKESFRLSERKERVIPCRVAKDGKGAGTDEEQKPVSW